jgi:hypothetical protein
MWRAISTRLSATEVRAALEAQLTSTTEALTAATAAADDDSARFARETDEFTKWRQRARGLLDEKAERCKLNRWNPC